MTQTLPVLLRSTFPPDDVTVLLRAGEVQLVTVAEKEALLRAGRSYGTLLTPEAVPGAVQTQAFNAALARNGKRVGALLAGLSCTLLAAHPGAVYVSLARAGTPVGCALRRLARHAGHDVPHYTVSILRGEGLDMAALRVITSRHPGAPLVFIDGWSGKGAIAGTLRASLPPGLDWSLAMLSDPAGVADHAGTHEDLLLPHAALNATVSGLLSRTFSTAPGELHGARVEHDLATHDVTRAYVEALEHLALEAAPKPAPPESTRPTQPVAPVLALARELGVHNPNLVKPSVGEATRVFLRRAPSHLLVRQGGHPDTAHLEALAAGEGVLVTVHPDLPYLAAALIRPGEGA